MLWDPALHPLRRMGTSTRFVNRPGFLGRAWRPFDAVKKRARADAATGTGPSDGRGYRTVVEGFAVLLELTGSATPLATLMVLLIVPLVLGFTTMVTVALASLARLPRLQVTVLPERLQLPLVVFADTKVRLVGRVSVNLDADAVEGPLLVTVAL